MIRKIAIVALTAIASWLTLIWADSHIRPTNYSLRKIRHQFSMANDLSQWRKLAVVVDSRYTLRPGEKPRRFREFDIPGWLSSTKIPRHTALALLEF